ncbi:hypothetical protein [Streptomyces sp. NPDC058657]|uniref:hypothetical protein n=1 Tax=unclassified Streptomyces TaxID=2593676 RepID=UPI003660A3FA
MNATVAPDPYDPSPGTEYAYPLSDYARAARRFLGSDWGAESGWHGASGLLFTRDARVSLRLAVDHEDDLHLDGFDASGPRTIYIMAEQRPEGPPSDAEDMAEWGRAIAAVVTATVTRIP